MAKRADAASLRLVRRRSTRRVHDRRRYARQTKAARTTEPGGRRRRRKKKKVSFSFLFPVVSNGWKGEAHFGDVAEEDFGGRFDALEAHDDAGAPARLGELHAGGVHPHACAAHVRRAPLVCARVALDGAAREAREFHRVAREGDARDARVQRCEQECFEQRGLACVRVELWR